MKFQMRGILSAALGCLAVVLLSLPIWRGDVEAASDCYLKCFVTEEDARVCVVEGHRLYDQITVRVEGGDQCLSSIEQARNMGFMVLGAPESKPAETQPAPEVIPAETPEAFPEEAPEPASEPAPEPLQPESERAVDVVETVPPEPEPPVEPSAQESPELPEDTTGEFSTEIPYGSTPGFGMLDMLRDPVGLAIIAVILLIVIFYLACWWILFSKADVPGWLSIIPIVNLFFFVKISGKSVLWFILLFVPFISIIAWLLVCLGVAERFGKGAFIGIILCFLPFIGLPILAFTGEYQG